MNSYQLIQDISSYLSNLQIRVINNNRNGKNDLNKFAEHIVASLLDIIFSTNFKVLEYEKKNTPSIDLGCLQNKIAVQVTSDTSLKKVKDTITSFFGTKYEYPKKYTRLYIIYIGNNPPKRKKLTETINQYLDEAKKDSIYFEVNTDELITENTIWDIPTLENEITNRFAKNNTVLERINNYLSHQLQAPHDIDRYIDGEKLFDKIINLYNKEARKNKDILSALTHLFDTFEGLIVFPSHILVNLYPFSLRDNSRAYYSYAALYTDNYELYLFFDRIVEEKKIQAEKPFSNFDSEKIDEILTRLRFNHIEHIHYDSKSSEKICIHKLFNTTQCDCSRCSFNRLNFIQSHKGLKYSNKGLLKFEALRNAYVHFQFADYKTAYTLYTDLAKLYYKEKKYIGYFICEYNLAKLSFFFRIDYQGDDKDTIVQELTNKELDKIILLLEKKTSISEEQLSVIKWINNDKYLHKFFIKINITVQDIINTYNQDQLGNFSTHHLKIDLENHLVDLLNFIEGNLLIYDDFHLFNLIINKILEGFLALYSIQNSFSTQYKTIDIYLLKVIILYGNNKAMQQLLEYYEVSILKFENEQNEASKFVYDRINNFVTSIDTISTIIQKRSVNNSTIFKEKINQIFENIIIMLSRIEMPDSEFNQCVEKILLVYPKPSILLKVVNRSLDQLIASKGGSMLTSTLEIFLEKSLIANAKYSNNIIANVSYQLHLKDANYVLTNEPLIKRILETYNLTDNVKLLNWENLYYLWEICSLEFKLEIRTLIESNLCDSFDEELYYGAALKGLIDYAPFLDQFVMSISRYWLGSSMMHVQNDEPYTINIRLNAFINLAYKFNINLDQETFKELHHNGLYYQWLMNPKDFDYSGFDANWILIYPSQYYFNTFNKIPQVKYEIEKAMNTKYSKGLAKVYFEYFV